MQVNNKLFFAKIAMRGACTESPRKWLNTAGAYLVQAPESDVLPLGEGRAVPPVYPRACVGTPSFTLIAFFAKKYLNSLFPVRQNMKCHKKLVALGEDAYTPRLTTSHLKKVTSQFVPNTRGRRASSGGSERGSLAISQIHRASALPPL